MHCTSLVFALNSHHCVSELNSSFLMHSIGLALTLNNHYCISELHVSHFIHCTDLDLTLNSSLRIQSQFCFLKSIPPTLLLLSTVIIAYLTSLSPFLYCTDLVFFPNSHHCVFDVNLALFVHSTDFTLTLNSYHYVSELYVALFTHCISLLSLLKVISAYPISFLLSLFIPLTLL